MLPSFLPFNNKPAQLTAGTYVISVTQLLGVYEPLASTTFWKSTENRAKYKALCEAFGDPMSEAMRTIPPEERRGLVSFYDYLRGGKVLYELRQRPPDERIGYSLFVYRLAQEDIDALTRL
jgi:hypothetical protein